MAIMTVKISIDRERMAHWRRCARHIGIYTAKDLFRALPIGFWVRPIQK